MTQASLRSLCFFLLFLPGFTKGSFAAKPVEVKYGKVIDSLLKAITNSRNDTAKVNSLNALAFAFYAIDPDSTDLFAKNALTLSKKLGYAAGEASALSNRGLAHWAKDDYSSALKYYTEAFKIDSTFKNKKGMATRLGNIGLVYRSQSDYPRALTYYFEALRIDEELKNKDGIGRHLGNIGLVYFTLKEYAKALEFYQKALKVDEEQGRKAGIAASLGNMGSVYNRLGNHQLALECYFKSLRLNQELGRKKGIGVRLGNIGSVYDDMGDFKGALSYYQKAIAIFKEIDNKRDYAVNLGNIGSLYADARQYSNAIGYLKEAIAIADTIGDLEQQEEWNRILSQVFDSTRNYVLALKYYEKYVKARKSVFNEESTKRQVRAEMQNEFQKQQTADSINKAAQTARENLKQEQEMRQQETYTYGGVIAAILMLLLAGVSILAFRLKQNANKKISEQKLLVEQKQSEIISSIHYAKRIQQSILPRERNLEKNLARLMKGK